MDEGLAIATSLEIYRTAIPMRSFEHATASRELAEAIVVRMEFADGQVGWGETLPREYVTGETLDSVVADLQGLFWPAIRGRAAVAADVSAVAAGVHNRCVNAAACAMDLALFGRASRLRGSRADGGGGDTSGQRIRRGHGALASRVSGVLGSRDPARTAKRLRLMRLYGLRDFKLKLGFADDIDEENLRLVHRRLGPAIRRGKSTLRVDVNGAWEVETVPDRIRRLKELGVCAVEQPVNVPAEWLVELARKCVLPLIADESLLSEADARLLSATMQTVWWNIRISKNGGLEPALRLCQLAAEAEAPFVVGCLVGESGILSSAQRRLLERCPMPRFVEGNYGRFLLADDLTRPSPRFGYGGRLRRLSREGLGVTVDRRKLERYGKRLARCE